MKRLIVFLVLISFIFTGCGSNKLDLKAQAEGDARAFFNRIESGNYEAAYNDLVSELKELRNVSDFALFLNASQSFDKISFNVDQAVIEDEGNALLYYSYYSQKYPTIKSSSVKMVFVSGVWKIDGFREYLTKTCVVDNCKNALVPDLSKTFIARCLSSGHKYNECEYLAERDYGNLEFKCDKSTGYICEVAKTE